MGQKSLAKTLMKCSWAQWVFYPLFWEKTPVLDSCGWRNGWSSN